jgi:hypothetical protein
VEAQVSTSLAGAKKSFFSACHRKMWFVNNRVASLRGGKSLPSHFQCIRLVKGDILLYTLLYTLF